MAKEQTRVKKRERKNITSGVAHVNATFNNTMITITDAQGNGIAWPPIAYFCLTTTWREFYGMKQVA